MAVAGSILFDTKTDLSGFNKGTSQIESGSAAMLKNVGKRMASIGVRASVAGAVLVGIGKKLLEANSVQTQAETKLTEIYKSRMGATEEAAKSTMKYASALQKTGVVGDEVTLSGAQQLATFAKMPSTVNKLLPAMDNLLVQQKGYNGTAEDARNIANLMGKAMQGQVGALTRVGISFTEAQEKVLKYGTEEERAAMLSQVITDNVGEMNKAFAKTDEGKIQQAKNTLGDMAEELGAILLPALASIAKWLSNHVLPKLQKLISTAKKHPIIGKIAVAITAILAVGGPLLMLFGGMAVGLSSLIGLFGKTAAKENAMTAATKRLTLAQKLQAVGTKIATAAQKVFNFVMKANPILLVASAIGTLVGVLGFFALKSGNVDKWFANFNKKINEFAEKLPVMIDNIAKNAPKIIEKLITAIAENLPTLIKGAAKIIIAIVKGIIKALPALAKAAPKIIKALVVAIGLLGYELAKLGLKLVKKLATGLKNGLARIKEVGANLVTGLWNGITGKVKWIINKIKGFGKSVVKGMKKIFGMKSPPKNTFANGLVTSFGIGEYFSEGMANGIIKAGKDALSAAQTVGEKTTAALQSSLGIPTLTPAIATGTVAPAAALASNPVTAGQVNQIIQATSTGQSISINFTGDLSALGRVLKPVLDKEAKRIGKQQVRL